MLDISVIGCVIQFAGMLPVADSVACCFTPSLAVQNKTSNIQTSLQFQCHNGNKQNPFVIAWSTD